MLYRFYMNLYSIKTILGGYKLSSINQHSDFTEISEDLYNLSIPIYINDRKNLRADRNIISKSYSNSLTLRKKEFFELNKG